MSLTYDINCFFINVPKMYNNVMFTDEFKAKSIILHPWTGCLMHADDLFQVPSKQCGPEAREWAQLLKAITWYGLGKRVNILCMVSHFCYCLPVDKTKFSMFM